ncbi:hypothetical protein TNCV_4463911 [Trichonephila clavipes]|nr:hypothetical protein TNCV_4463911 [Trichonephila clavipes]
MVATVAERSWSRARSRRVVNLIPGAIEELSSRRTEERHVVDIYELVCAGDCTCGNSHLELCRFAFGILTESITLFLELSCNLIVKKFDNLNVLARLHLGVEKELKRSHLDASLKSSVQDFLQVGYVRVPLLRIVDRKI